MMDGVIDVELFVGSFVFVVVVWISWIIVIVRLGGVVVFVGFRFGFGEEIYGMV